MWYKWGTLKNHSQDSHEPIFCVLKCKSKGSYLGQKTHKQILLVEFFKFLQPPPYFWNMSRLKNRMSLKTFYLFIMRLTFLIHIHLVLSISMTACSSIMALGMMPLCLLIYTSIWTASGSIQIPYDSIGKQKNG